MAIWSSIFKEHLSTEEVDRRHSVQKELTATYLQGGFGEGSEAVDKFNAEWKKVETPIDLVALAASLKFKKIT